MYSFPFDSVVTYDADGIPVYDRPYDASSLRNNFMAFFSDGVFYLNSSAMQVTATEPTSMAVEIQPGQIHIQGVVARETEVTTLDIDPIEVSGSRIDRIICRLNDNESVRDCGFYVLKGEESTSTPQPPDIVRANNIYDMVLAEVEVTGTMSRVSDTRITDTRLNADVCGIVTSNPQYVDTTTLFKQFQSAYQDYIDSMDSIEQSFATQAASTINEWIDNFSDLRDTQKKEFDEWFENLEYVLDGDVAGHLQEEIEELEKRADLIEYMGIQNDWYAALADDDGVLLADDDDSVIISDWKYQEQMGGLDRLPHSDISDDDLVLFTDGDKLRVTTFGEIVALIEAKTPYQLNDLVTMSKTIDNYSIEAGAEATIAQDMTVDGYVYVAPAGWNTQNASSSGQYVSYITCRACYSTDGVSQTVKLKCNTSSSTAKIQVNFYGLYIPKK